MEYLEISDSEVIKYFDQFTLRNLLERKHFMNESEWKTWIQSLNEYELNCVASTLHFDEVVKERYNHYRYSRIMLERFKSLS